MEILDLEDNELEDESYGPGSALEFRGNELEQIERPSTELINKCTEVIKLFKEVINSWQLNQEIN